MEKTLKRTEIKDLSGLLKRLNVTGANAKVQRCVLRNLLALRGAVADIEADEKVITDKVATKELKDAATEYTMLKQQLDLANQNEADNKDKLAELSAKTATAYATFYKLNDAAAKLGDAASADLAENKPAYNVDLYTIDEDTLLDFALKDKNNIKGDDLLVLSLLFEEKAAKGKVEKK